MVPDTLSQPRLLCCCKYLCSQITSLVLPVPLCQGQNKNQNLKTHTPNPLLPVREVSHSRAVPHISEGDCWAVVSWLKALFHLLIAALTSELLKFSGQTSTPLSDCTPFLLREESQVFSLIFFTFSLSFSIPSTYLLLFFPMFVKSFCPQPQLSVPWEQGIQQLFSCQGHQ